MSSPSSNKSQVLRSAAILTTSEVANAVANDFVVNRAWSGRFTLLIDFTIGSLTNCVFKYYVSMDQVTYYPIETVGGVVSHTLTATGTKVVTLSAPGWSYFRASAQGSGTVTSSSATLTVRWNPRGV